jgi:hypothetical protein
VYGALNKGFVQIQKLVFLPFEGGTGMRALIEVAVKFPVFMYNKDGLGFAFDFNLKCLAAGVFNIVCIAENVSHNVW